MSSFKDELEELINKHNMERASNTPDFILSQYLCDCLLTLEIAVQQRETFYGRGGEAAKEVLRNQLAAANERIEDEKQRRIYYQDIVYAVCNQLDKVYSPKTVCGTAVCGTTQVQERMSQLIAERDRLREELQSIYHE